ncbi:hypothetical protein MKX01_011900 [Papaver californicum]|nr:hypothetical protein MKX01_011900 [Papaver californicum]
MEQFTFKGSIPEAIVEARQQKKLFVVYVSENDGASVPVDESTSADLNVAASVTKYCVLLHLLQGSTEASQFSAIYPQKSVPCVTIIGYNGVMLAQHEGLINYENLISSAKQGWVSLQIQETAATAILSKAAALASSKTQAQSSNSSNTTSFEQGRSSSSEMPASSKEESLQDSKQTKEKQDEARAEETIAALASNKTEAQTPDSSNSTSFEQGGSSSSEILSSSKEKSHQDLKDQQLLISKQKKEKQDEAITESNRAHKLERVDGDQSALASEQVENFLRAAPTNLNMSENQIRPSDAVSGPAKTVESRGLKDPGLESVGPGVAANVMKISALGEKDYSLDHITDARKSTDVHLNIRLPNGANLQKKFSVTDTLGSIKNYVDENQSSLGAYDLAVPYPRRVFSEQDLRKELSELGLLNRQALIVVKHHRASLLNKSQSFSRDQSDVNTSNEGYFGRVKRLLSYVNPLSYLGNSISATSSGQGPNEGLWQYRPERTNMPHSPNTNTTGTNQNTNKSSKPTVSGFGSSNIRTLNNYRNDDGPSPSNDRNTFWNGNSTEYGGNNNDGK